MNSIAMKHFIVVLLVAICGCSAGRMISAPVREASIGRDVREFGSVGDGRADDTAAFQNAIDETERAGGGIVCVSRGDYLIKTHLVVKKDVTLKGVFVAPTARAINRGSTLLAVEEAGGMDGTPFITLNESAALDGMTIFYPQQSKETPRPYPWTVRGEGDNCTIRNCLFVNPYAAVDFGTKPAGRHFIDG